MNYLNDGRTQRWRPPTTPSGRIAGFTLVELMISLLLGLLLIAGVGSVFLANKDAYRSNEALSQAQDAARTAFEFLARDIRAAGSNPCGAGSVQSALTGSEECGGTEVLPGWVDDFAEAISGTEDAASIAGLPGSGNVGAPVSGSDAIRIGKAEDLGIRLDEDEPAPTAANLKLAAPTALLDTNDVVMVCDAAKATVFQITTHSDASVTFSHNTGTGSVGNCTKGLNHPIFNDTNGNGTTLGPTSYLAVPRSTYWYVGTNAAGGRSLYRARNRQTIGDPDDAVETQEMVRGVESMSIQYHIRGQDAFTNANDISISDWGKVDAVWLRLTIRSRGTGAADPDIGAGSERQRLERTFSTTVAIRNRLEN